MKKRILGILLTLCMVLCLAPTSVLAEGETAEKAAAANSEVSVTVTSAAEFIKAIDDTNTRTEETTVIRIGKNFTVSLSECEGYFLIKTKVIIDLNYHGFSIKQDIDSDKAFYLTDEAELTIRDSTRFQYGVLKIIGNGKKAISAVRFSGNSSAILRLESGTLEGENLEYNRKMVDGRVYGTPGGFVRLDEKNAKFIMTGGTIKNFYGVYGGAVSVEYGKFVMEGGTIQNCYARNGGAISVDYGKNAVLTIGGGSGTPVIKNNSAIGPGGGLAVSDTSSQVEIKGGLFEDNYSTGSDEAPVNLKNGAELYVDYGCEVKMSGGTIKNSGTGQYAISSEGKFTVTGDAVIDINSQHCTLSCSGADNYFFDFDGGYAIIKGRYAAGDAFSISDTNGLRFGSSESALGEIKSRFRNEDIADAQYIKIAKKRTVTFKLAENEPTPLSSQTVLNGEKIQKPADPPLRDGYIFNDIWAIPLGDGYKHWDFGNDVLTGDTILYGRWSGYRVKVTFNANGYSMSGSPEVYGEYGQKLKDLRGVPTINPASFMKFMGWYTESSDGTRVDENTILTSDMTLYAKCAPQYTVFIYYVYEKDGQTVTFQVMNHLDENGRVPKPYGRPDPPAGYVFDDWYVGGASYGAMTENYTKLKTVADLFKEYGTMEGASAKIKLIARFAERTDYKVDFKSDGNIIYTRQGLKWADVVLDGIAEPIRNGYRFAGWKCGDKAVAADAVYSRLAVNDTITSITLTAQWEDVEKPTGKIIIGENKWNSFLNNITFGLFFNETQTVTVTAADNSGDAVKIEYLLSNKELTVSELKNKTFTAYNGQFNINPDNKYIVYVKLTDKAGNTDYICSDGIVLDGTNPVITGIENGKTYCEAQTVTITEMYIGSIKVNGADVTLDENNSFVLSVADGEQKIVVTDKAGNPAQMTVTVNDGHTFGEWTSNGDGTHTHKCMVDGCNGTETENCSGGKATCTEKAVCEVCGKVYGELDENNHADLKHIDAKAATKDAKGNIEYWYCEGCGKYYSDADATKEITKAATVTAKLPDEPQSPKTGDNSNIMLWFVLLFISGGICTPLIVKRKKLYRHGGNAR